MFSSFLRNIFNLRYAFEIYVRIREKFGKKILKKSAVAVSDDVIPQQWRAQ
jgi:hypothetical protein